MDPLLAAQLEAAQERIANVLEQSQIVETQVVPEGLSEAQTQTVDRLQAAHARLLEQLQTTPKP